MSTRKRFSREYKRQAVELVCRPDASRRQSALDMVVGPNFLASLIREGEEGGSRALSSARMLRDHKSARAVSAPPQRVSGAPFIGV